MLVIIVNKEDEVNFVESILFSMHLFILVCFYLLLKYISPTLPFPISMCTLDSLAGLWVELFSVSSIWYILVQIQQVQAYNKSMKAMFFVGGHCFCSTLYAHMG